MRIARTVPLAFALILLTVMGHSVGSHALPTVTGLVVISVPALAIAFAFSGHRRSVTHLIGYLIAAELLLHLLLTATAGHGHLAHLLPTQPMVLAHIVATIAAAIVFAYGESVVARWLAYLRQGIGAPTLPRVSTPIWLAPMFADVPARLTDLLLDHHVVRRGPPAFAA